MAKTATLTISVAYSGDGIGAANTYSVSAVNAAAPGGGPQLLALASGANTITPPTGTTLGALIRPPSSSTVVKTIKGVAGDTGITNWTSKPAVVPIAAGATFVINAASAENVDVFWA